MIAWGTPNDWVGRPADFVGAGADHPELVSAVGTETARILFVSHEPEVEPGYLSDAATRRGFAVEVCDLWAGSALPEPTGYELIIPLGSAEAAYDDTVPWLADELAWLRHATHMEVAVFGVCFGAQALARALGGSVRPASEPEVGWYEIETAVPELIPAGPWLQWHFDTPTTPPGAVTLARSPVGVQAYRLGRQLGVQFHPEVTPKIVDAWIASSGEQLAGRGLDVAALAAETRERVPEARAAAHRLFDQVVEALEVPTPPR